MDFNDTDGNIIGAFYNEWHKDWYHTTWADFIIIKDLGIHFVQTINECHYTIVNDKKWLYSKLKYGI